MSTADRRRNIAWGVYYQNCKDADRAFDAGKITVKEHKRRLKNAGKRRERELNAIKD